MLLKLRGEDANRLELQDVVSKKVLSQNLYLGSCCLPMITSAIGTRGKEDAMTELQAATINQDSIAMKGNAVFQTIAGAHAAALEYQEARQAREETDSEYQSALSRLNSMKTFGAVSAAIHGLGFLYMTMPFVWQESGVPGVIATIFIGLLVAGMGWSGGVGLLGFGKWVKDRGFILWISVPVMVMLFVIVIMAIYGMGVFTYIAQTNRVKDLKVALMAREAKEAKARKVIYQD